ncbi:MAG: STAS domain-containing protein [Chloroflexi bacterium]|nr:STAS domain-containing protein [Chloroflexota bacterium]
MGDQLTITKSTEGDVCVLHLAGRLDAQTEDALVKNAQDEHDTGATHLLLDLSKLEMLTSAGLRALLNMYKLFTPKAEADAWEKEHPDEPYKSTYFKLAGASPEIYYILNIAGFLRNIPVFADLQEGLKSFK